MGLLGEGLSSYYRAKIEELEIQARDKQHNLRRLEAQRNELNTKGAQKVPERMLCCPQERQIRVCEATILRTEACLRIAGLNHGSRFAVRLLREELQLLQEPGSYVGEVVKVRSRDTTSRFSTWAVSPGHI